MKWPKNKEELRTMISNAEIAAYQAGFKAGRDSEIAERKRSDEAFTSREALSAEWRQGFIAGKQECVARLRNLFNA